MSGPVVSVAVVTYDSRRHLEPFVAALPAAAGDVPYELVVADNASNDGSAALVRELRPDATVVEGSDNRGYAAGVNAAVRASRGRDAVLICNPDVRLGDGAIAHLLGALKRPRAGVAAPRTTTERGTLVYSLRRDQTVRRALGEAVIGGTRARRYETWSQVVGDERAYASTHTVDWASGAVLMCARQCLDAVGPWDESFFMYSEEVDFQLRAREHGYCTWYEPAANAVHIGGDLHTSGVLWSMQMRNKVQLFSRRHSRPHTAAYRAALVLNETIRAPVGNIHREGLRALLLPSAR